MMFYVSLHSANPTGSNFRERQHGARLRLDLGGRQIRNALAQQDFNGAQLSHSKAYFTEGALMQPIDKLTRSDFFRT
jgi:hypothetical protein